MPGADLGYFFEIRLRRHDHAARTHHRLGDEGSNSLRVFAPDHLLELGRKPAREILLALAGLRETVVMRAGCVQKAFDREIEVQMIMWQSAERSAGHGNTVIGPQPGNKFLF